jgi:hypothetical protein
MHGGANGFAKEPKSLFIQKSGEILEIRTSLQEFTRISSIFFPYD